MNLASFQHAGGRKGRHDVYPTIPDAEAKRDVTTGQQRLIVVRRDLTPNWFTLLRWERL